jgi:predicted transcriptional regulator
MDRRDARDRAGEHLRDHVQKPVISVDPSMDIRYCARLFDKFGLSRAPVVNSGKIVGLISYTDMVLKGLCRGL